MQPSTQYNQAPGERQGQNHSADAVIKLTGNPQVMRHVTKGFIPELTGLIHRAGFGGTFTVRVDTYAKGTPHTKGLRIKTPSKWGLDITWHEGSNDNCIAMCIMVPAPLDRMSFHSKLKAAQAALAAEDEAEEALPHIVLAGSPPTPVILPDLTTKPPQVLGVAPPQTLNGSKHESFEEAADNARERFVDDSERVELFMLEIIGEASPEGWVPTSLCSKVIQSAGYLKGLSSVFRSLVAANHLERVPTQRGGLEGFRITKRWLEKLRPEAVVKERIIPSAAPVAQRVQEVVEEVVPVSASPKLNGSHVQPEKLLKQVPASEQIKHLSAVADKVRRQRVRQTELKDELAGIDHLMALQTARRAKIVEDLAKVNSYLSQPEVTEAEAKFAQVSAILGS